MESKKNPKADVSRNGSIYFAVGLALMLFLTYSTINYKTYDKSLIDIGQLDLDADLDEEIPLIDQIKPPPPPPPPPAAPEVIDIVEDEEEIEETVEYKKTTSPLEKYSNKKIVVPSKDELDLKQLEREIMQHAISSSIILDAESLILEEPESTTEENIESNKVEISKDDFEKFGLLDWLKANEEGELEKKTRQKNTKELISSFIRKVPEKITSASEKQTLIEINRPKHEFFSPENMAKLSLMENEDIVTETLAKIYAQQGNFAKARKAYDKLSLKFPEKSDYFARLKKELNIKQ